MVSHAPEPVTSDTSQEVQGPLYTVSPDVLAQYLGDIQPRVSSIVDRNKTSKTSAGLARTLTERKGSRVNLNDDLSTTSGIESDGGEDDDEVESDDEVGEADNGDSTDSESGGFEPSLEEIRLQLPNPQTIFPLRPDNLDPLFVHEDTWDLHHFDPDFPTDAEQPTNTFPCPLPCFLDSINLGQCARHKSDWRECWPAWRGVELPLQGLVDRLVEMHKMQAATEEWETRKLRGRQRRQDRVALNSSNSSNRATSSRARDRRGTADTLGIQSGDSPEKRPATGSFCKKCSQLLPCSSECQNHQHELSIRSRPGPVSSNTPDVEKHPPTNALPPAPPSRGYPVLSRRGSSRLISASGLTVVRPKSCSFSTSRTRPSRSGDARPTSAISVNPDLVHDFDRLNVGSAQSGKAPGYRPASRSSLLAGRRYRQSRRSSLSDLRNPRDRTKQGRCVRVPQPAS